MKTQAEYEAQAEKILADQAADLHRVKVKNLAKSLAEQDRRLEASDFPTDPDAMRARHAELIARFNELDARDKAARKNPALTLSAIEDHEHQVLRQRIYEMEKRLRVIDRISPAAA